MDGLRTGTRTSPLSRGLSLGLRDSPRRHCSLRQGYRVFRWKFPRESSLNFKYDLPLGPQTMKKRPKIETTKNVSRASETFLFKRYGHFEFWEISLVNLALILQLFTSFWSFSLVKQGNFKHDLPLGPQTMKKRPKIETTKNVSRASETFLFKRYGHFEFWEISLVNLALILQLFTSFRSFSLVNLAYILQVFSQSPEYLYLCF